MKLLASETVISFLTIFSTLFMVPALSESLVRKCGDVQVYFSADNGSTQHIACCMQNPTDCKWIFAGDPQANVTFQEQQTGLVLTLKPGIDLFGRYKCFNQMNGTEEEINFLPVEGGCLILANCSIRITTVPLINKFKHA